MMEFIEIYIDTVIIWISAYFVGVLLLKPSNKITVLNKIVVVNLFSVILAFINMINSEILHGIIKILVVYLLQCSFYKCMFNKSMSKTVIIAFIWYLFLCVSEIIVVLIASGILELFGNSIIFMKNNFVLNLIISIVNYLIVRIFSVKFQNVLNNSDYNSKVNIIIIIIALITVALLLYRIPLNKWKLDAEFMITMAILLGFCIIGIYMIKQKSDIQKTTSMYQQVVKYSNMTNKLLEDYRIVSHEHKNQLSIIRQMTNPDNTKVTEYIDNLLNMRNVIKYKWVADLNHLSLEGLKGLINYKLLEMEDSKIDSKVIISKEVSKIKLNKLSTKQQDNLYSIVGVYLDNAIQAAKESKKKEISLDIYKENKDLVLIIANTYKGKIDLNKIDDYGYTTKGSNHGIGLHIVKKILSEDVLFSQKRTMADDYYIQELKINMSKLKKKK